MTVIAAVCLQCGFFPQTHPAWIRFFVYKILLLQSLYYTFKKKNPSIPHCLITSKNDA